MSGGSGSPSPVRHRRGLGDFSLGDYLIWNEILTVIGNLVGGLLFVGLTMYATHARPGLSRRNGVSPDVEVPGKATVG
ncbi:hypothetical protein F4560_003013 [Saccharothrix ecbatanensis]|uniref:Uncharacterized protein n=1 Tax=Saccharothrix ecbatanensis TaxID=1105145 RepID=A0A7W9M0S9_9PSEU|nr:formate/nitrite transporter family protein [Saccharothrix ecbatanensis]MBB5803245.1 hypothetical protein [Saccharothrix ecbatanensis]